MSGPPTVPALKKTKSISEYINECNTVDLSQAEQLFALIDRDNTGKISAESLRRVFEDMGVGTSRAEIRDLMLQLDTDGDGLVDFADFQQGILFMQRAFGFDSPKDAASAKVSLGNSPLRSGGLSESDLLRRVARDADRRKKKKKKKRKKKKDLPVVSVNDGVMLTARDQALPQEPTGQSAVATPGTLRRQVDLAVANASGLGDVQLLVESSVSSSESQDVGESPESADQSLSSSESEPLGEPLRLSQKAGLIRAHRSSVSKFVQQLTPSQYGEIERLFQKFDTSGSGKIAMADLESIIRHVDPELPEAEVKKMVRSCGEGQAIGFQDFLQSMHALFKALRFKKLLHQPHVAEASMTLRKLRYNKTNSVGHDLNTKVKDRPVNRTHSRVVPNIKANTIRDSDDGSVSSLGEGADVNSVDEALWAHIELLEEELHAARQEITLLSKLTKARERESRLMSDPQQLAGVIVRMAQRDGEQGERAAAALAAAVAKDERLVRRIMRRAHESTSDGRVRSPSH